MAMARYNGYSSYKNSMVKKKRIENAKKLKALRKINETVSANSQENINNRNKAIEYYNSLSDYEKQQFDKELELKKVRENYIAYLKYIFGENYIITPFHSFLAKVCETIVKKVEKGEKVRICVSVPPQHGKGYPVDFPILTNKGWKKHGDLQVGDYVYNDEGKQVKVIGTQEHYMHPCMKITFANGETQIITKEHLWKVFLEKEQRVKIGNKKIHRNIREERVLETQEIKKLLPKQRRSPYVAMNMPLQNSEKKLPIHPYILGLWLGDGCSANSQVVCADFDLPNMLSAIGDKENYKIVKRKNDKNISHIVFGNEIERNGRTSYLNDFRKRLHELDILHNKHIPIEYLLANESQRWELLRGLMDTDGCVDNRGNCEFCNINKELAYNTYTLLHSLGIKARIGEYDAKLYGRFVSKKYKVIFSADRDMTIFRLDRKQERVYNKKKQDRDDKYKYFIKSIEDVGEQLVSCISVEGNIYLSGKELIPTHNSTTITETLPSWFVGRNPNLRCILTSYNADIAEKFGDRNREKVKKYGKEIFNIDVSDTQDNKTLFNIKDKLGGIYSTGITGSLTSNQGALIIIDDPFKNGVEAENPTIRQNVWDIFCDSIMTRQRGNGNAIFVIMTRWHDDDLIGRIKNIDNGEWIFINLPCEWESGEDKYLHRKVGDTLCPQLGFDARWLEQLKRTIGIKKFNTLYQGKPYSDGGEIVKRTMVKLYDKKTLPNVFEEITMSCDLSFGTKGDNSDPNGIGIWGRVGGNHYLIECINKKMSFAETLDKLRFLCGKYPMMRRKIVESKANGNATIEILNREIGGFIGYNPKESKQARLELVMPFFESGNVYFPDESVDKDSEVYIDQLTKFPKSTHDEIVDITTQYLLNYEYKTGGKVITDNKYSEFAKAIKGLRI